MSDFSVSRLLAAALVCVTSAAAAQNGNSNKENDPYSRYGLGEMTTGTSVLNRGMGYTSTAFQNAAALNTDNPASYPSLRLTTYEAAFTGGLRSIDAGNQNYNTGSLTLSYLRVGIPLGKHGGMAFGLEPRSHVYYHNVDTAATLINENGGSTIINKNASEYTGEGGLNYAFIGGGYSFGGFSFGANFGYLFGNIRNTSRLVNLDSTKMLGSDFSRYTRIGGIYWKGGLQWHDTLRNGWNYRLGATLELSQQINASRETYGSSFFYYGLQEVQDTAYSLPGQQGKITIPATYSFGAQLGGGNWSLAADITRTDWNQYQNFGLSDSVTDKTMRYSLGGEFTPAPGSVYHYFQRVTYRMGFYYGDDYVQLHDTKLNYYGLTVGASFPFKRGADRVHTALEFGRRGTTENGLVQMNYFRLHLGISLNDRWFIKRKYD
ncbi:MAG: hypothetical protein JST06_04355 [Bacteroidetes bacterium]|nr:hypothetical protein [Bacteroidota bacterium]MBS1630276.1 hypothetical protein [Bacteroidota bacterium]